MSSSIAFALSAMLGEFLVIVAIALSWCSVLLHAAHLKLLRSEYAEK